MIALMALSSCKYDRSWDQGTPIDASYEAAPGRTVTEPDLNDGSTPVSTGKTCDLFVQDCPQGQGCYRTGCALEGTVAVGATCTWDTDCQHGALCDTGTSPARCHTICKNVDEDDCQQWCCINYCVPVGDRRLPVETGVCRQP